ncbi:MAG TPA: adenylyltransferase/cytidyltransferase family protein, partial [Phycisphaerales bacterium]|nr:adenylyltransferase/cytidyltransferase family protein [Phycisphaerales bacterium]
QVFGAVPIPFARVQREVLALTTPLQGKVRTLENLLVEVAVHREEKKCIVFTNGCFDVLHAGHVQYLREAKALGDVLIVAINADAEVRRQKGEGRPIHTAADRLEVLSELQCVDYLLVFEEPTVENLLREIVPDKYVKGGDYSPQQVNEYPVVRELGIEMCIVSHKPGHSSRTIVQKIKENTETKPVDVMATSRRTQRA